MKFLKTLNTFTMITLYKRQDSISTVIRVRVPTHVAEIQHNLFQNSLKQFLEFRYCITEDIEGGEMTVPFATRCKQ